MSINKILFNLILISSCFPFVIFIWSPMPAAYTQPYALVFSILAIVFNYKNVLFGFKGVNLPLLTLIVGGGNLY